LKVGLDPHMKKTIAQAIMEKPELLILGLDKQGVTEMRTLFKNLNRQGVTIILFSHYSEDIDALCDTGYFYTFLNQRRQNS